MAPRDILPGLLLAALLAPACGTGNPTIPDVTRAVIDLSVDPNPVAATQNAITASVSAAYKITLTETNGLGGQVVFVSSAAFDPTTGKQVALNYYDSADLIVYVGSDRVEPLSTLVVPHTATYTLADLSKATNLVVSVQIRDDRKNLVNASLLLKIE